MKNTKIYFEKHSPKSYQFWFSWSPNSGKSSYMDMIKPPYKTNKSGDSNFDGDVDEIVSDWSSQNKPVKKIGDTSIFKIPVYQYEPHSTARRLEVWGGDIKPIEYVYMSVDSNKTITVIGFFKTLKEAVVFKKGYYAKGSTVGEELMGGQPNSSKPSGYLLLEVIGNGKEIIVSDDGGKTKEKYSKSNGFSGYTLRYKGNQYEFVSSYGKGSTIGVGNFSVWEIVKGNPKKLYTGSEMGANKFAKKYNSTMPKDGRGLETWDAKATEEQVAKHHQSSYGTATSQQYAKGSTVRANKSSLLKYANFEDNWHINLLQLNPYRNQDGLRYKGGNKYAVARVGAKSGQEVFEFKTLEEAENKFNELVELSKTYSPLVKEGKTSNYAKGGNTPSNWSYSIGGL